MVAVCLNCSGPSRRLVVGLTRHLRATGNYRFVFRAYRKPPQFQTRARDRLQFAPNLDLVYKRSAFSLFQTSVPGQFPTFGGSSRTSPCLLDLVRVRVADHAKGAHPNTLISIYNMGQLLWRRGKFAEAEPYHREAMAKYRRAWGEEHPYTLTTFNNLGLLLRDMGKFDEATRYLREGMEKRRRVLGEEHPDTLISIDNMGQLLQSKGDFAGAEECYRESLEAFRRVLGQEHPDTLISVSNMGSLLQAQGRNSQVVDLLAPAEPMFRNTFTNDNAFRLARLLATLGKARAELSQFTAAESNLLEAHAIFLSTRGDTHKDTRDAIQALVEFYTGWDNTEPGKGYDLKVAEWKTKRDAIPVPAAPPQQSATPAGG